MMKNEPTKLPKRRLGEWKAPENCVGCEQTGTIRVVASPSTQLIQGEEIHYETKKWQCSACGAEWMSPAQATAGVVTAVSIFQIKHGMLTAAESRAHREALDWTQEDLAEKSGVGIATIKRLESGVHILGKLHNDTIAKAFLHLEEEYTLPDYEINMDCTDFANLCLPVPPYWTGEEPWNEKKPWKNLPLDMIFFAADSNELALAG